MKLGKIGDVILPALFGRRNDRIKELLSEAEIIADNELRSEEVLAELYKTFLEFLDQSKQENIRKQFEKDYADIEKVDVLKPYCLKAYSTLSKVKYVLHQIWKLNDRSLKNAEELRQLVTEKNEAILGHLTPGQLSVFMGFQQICEERCKERTVIRNLLISFETNINNMMNIINKVTNDLNAFTNDEFVQMIVIERQKILDIVKAELNELGVEINSLENLDDLKEIGSHLFDRGFLDRAKQAKRMMKRYAITKRTAVALSVLLTTHLVGFQIIAPTYLASYESKYKSLEIQHPDIYKQLQRNSESITFTTPDNLELTGMLVFNKDKVKTDKAVLIVHGRNFNFSFHTPYVEYLRDNTKEVDFLMINQRGHGPDTPQGIFTDAAIARSTTMGLNESLDVVGAINHLAKLGYRQVVLYGFSMGGASVLHGAGMRKDMISKGIEVKGVIVEKTFAEAETFFRRMYDTWLTNFGVNILYGVTKSEFPKVKLGQPTEWQWQTTKLATEKAMGCKFEDNNPAKSVKTIYAPVLAIGNKGGDAVMIGGDQDVKKIVENAPHGTALLVDSEYGTLAERHNPENHNPIVLKALKDFVENNLK